VLDENLLFFGVRYGKRFALDKSTGGLGAAESGVDVSGTGDLETGKAVDWADVGDDFFGDLAWSFPELFSQFERERQCVLAQLDLRWLFDNYVREFDLKMFAKELPDAFD
jgi:hypothetical protein